jgi:integrase
MKLTNKSLAEVKRVAARKSDYVEWDDTLKGFGLRVRDGKCSWVFQYKFDHKHRRIRLGGDELSCNEARQLATAESGKLSKARLGHGVDPATQRDIERAKSQPAPKPRANTFTALVPIYLEARAGALRNNTYKVTRAYLERYWKPLHGLTVGAITRADVAATLTAITKDNGPVSANRARSALSRCFRWAIGEGLCDNNPVVGTNEREENGPRERSLSDAETAEVWLNAPDNRFGKLVRLILLTGCRKTELGDLKWREIDLAGRTITLPRERTKNRQEHVVPLSDSALAILEAIPRSSHELVFGRGQGGFQGWSKCKAELDKAARLKEPWTLHDLRRTVRTGLGGLGIQPHIAEAALNHLPAKLIRTYDRNTYAEEKRAALDQWATHLKTIVAQASGANVTALRKGDGRKPRG